MASGLAQSLKTFFKISIPLLFIGDGVALLETGSSMLDDKEPQT